MRGDPPLRPLYCNGLAFAAYTFNFLRLSLLQKEAWQSS
jgi:hypothetical protein